MMVFYSYTAKIFLKNPEIPFVGFSKLLFDVNNSSIINRAVSVSPAFARVRASERVSFSLSVNRLMK